MEIINKPEKIYLHIGYCDEFENDEIIDVEKLNPEEILWSTGRTAELDLNYYSKELMFEFAQYIIGLVLDGWDHDMEQLFKNFLKEREE